MGLSMAYHHHPHHVHSAAAVAAAAAHQHASGGPSYMDHFSNSAALSAAAAASAVSGSPPGSCPSSAAGAAYSNQAAVQAAIGSSLHQTSTVSSPSLYSINTSSGNIGNTSGVGGQQHSSSSPTSNLSHNHTSAALLASQVKFTSFAIYVDISYQYEDMIIGMAK